MTETQNNGQPSRLIAIGDIHGCLKELIGLLHRIDPKPDDQLVFLGDYIDRGPESSGVVEYLLDLKRDFPRTIYLMGNHERMFLDFLDDIDRLTFMINGGTMTLKSYQEEEKVRIPQHHIDFIRNLPLLHETEDHIFVHAGLKVDVELAQQQEQDMLWIREDFLNRDIDFGKVVVHGHSPVDKPTLTPHRIAIDTGAVYGRYLTGCDVEKRTFWHYPDPE
ncbi:MAG: serine/threonine protein phosphatase [Desulfuromonas sp.]|nr:MAG: serine/threonine protein phosphatase [Desulfuromonas sp.]